MIKNILRPLYVPIANWHYRTFRAPKRYHHLYDEIIRINAKTILEIGTWNGKRAKQMIQIAKQTPGDVSYIGFDLFEELTEEQYQYELSKRPPTKQEVADRLSETGATVSLIQGNTLETLPKFTTQATKVDFVFIDGGHHVETIQSDWDEISKLMHKDTVVIFDDYWRNRPTESAKPVVDKIDTEKYNVEILPEVDIFNNTDFGRLEISFAKVTLSS